MSDHRRTADAGEARRRRILDVATGMFARLGLSGARLTDVAAAAGLGNAGVLHHFATKDALYRVVLERLAAALEAEIGERVALHSDPVDRLRAFVDAQVAWALANPEGPPLLLRAVLDAGQSASSPTVFPLANVVLTGRDLLRDASGSLGLADYDPQVVLSGLFGALSYAAVVRPTFAGIFGEGATDDAEWLRQAGHLLLPAPLPKPADEPEPTGAARAPCRSAGKPIRRQQA